MATGDPGPFLDGEVGFIQVLLTPGWAKMAICSLLFSFAGGNPQILYSKLGYLITSARGNCLALLQIRKYLIAVR